MMLTARGTETDRIVGLELGADDYVVKPFSGAEVDRAHPRGAAAHARRDGRPTPAGGDGRRAGRSTSARGASTLDGEEVELSAARSSTCWPSSSRHAGQRRHARGPDGRVWDENWFGSTKTLDVHIGWLRRKLGDDPADPRFIHTVRGVGFRFAAPEEVAP